MAPKRVAVLLLAVLFFGACGDGPKPVQVQTVPSTSTTVTTLATTTTTAPVLRVAVVRPSRKLTAPRPAVVAQMPAVELPPIMLKIRWCESRDRYDAQNRRSTASGAWQFLDSSWAQYAGYPRAYLAPPEVQDQKALNVYNSVGTRPWNASRSCWS